MRGFIWDIPVLIFAYVLFWGPTYVPNPQPLPPEAQTENPRDHVGFRVWGLGFSVQGLGFLGLTNDDRCAFGFNKITLVYCTTNNTMLIMKAPT